ncbi:hypothetical protein ABBQ38_003779 [Trebouxia sp. C0009 RCD-2024]
MSKQLQQQLDRLQQDHPTEVLEETLLQLQAFVPKPGLGLQDAVDMTLAAIAVPEQAQLGSWAAHPLSKALLAQPLSHASLTLGTQRILRQAAQAGKHQQQLLQQLLLPFISFVLLHPDTTGGHIALKCGMHAQLVRAACTLPALQTSLLPQLVSFVSVYSWKDAGQAAWLASLIPDLVDAVQSTEGRSGDELAEQLAIALLHLLCEGQQEGHSLQPYLQGLRRLASDWPTLLVPFLPLLGACITAAGASNRVVAPAGRTQLQGVQY